MILNLQRFKNCAHITEIDRNGLTNICRFLKLIIVNNKNLTIIFKAISLIIGVHTISEIIIKTNNKIK